MRTKLKALALCVTLLAAASIAAQQPAGDVNAMIRKEETDNSQIMRTMHVLTDVYGPRLTGSPNHKAAAEWAVKQMTTWGLVNCHLEAWDFAHPGWLNERFSGFITSPVKDTLTCEVVAWTPGTNEPVAAQVYQMMLPDKPTQEELTANLATQKDKLRGNASASAEACGLRPDSDTATATNESMTLLLCVRLCVFVSPRLDRIASLHKRISH